MSLISAVDRLYQSRWLPSEDISDVGADMPRLADGRRYPSVAEIKRAFNDLGLSLSLKNQPDCVVASWSPVGETTIIAGLEDSEHGTVSGKSDAEAAVLALAKFRELQAQTELASSF